MWECRNCQETIEDRYQHCWNCGTPKTDASQASAPVRIRLKEPPVVEEVHESAAPPKAEIPREIPPNVEASPDDEIAAETVSPVEHFPFETASAYKERSSSKILSLVPLVLWLAAIGCAAAFAYYSNQKTKDFENRIREEYAALGGQSKQFVFSKNAPREKKGTITAKVLPLNATNNEVDSLYNNLPDDLRPATLDEVKSILWLDCKPSEAGTYEDGSPAVRDKCNAYLVDRTTSKVVQVQDFFGEPPPLKKQWGTSYASGKVLPETYIAYIKANQTETERAPFARAADSPAHHIWFKSEMFYATALLIVLGAVGFGWLVYKIKSAIVR